MSRVGRPGSSGERREGCVFSRGAGGEPRERSQENGAGGGA